MDKTEINRRVTELRKQLTTGSARSITANTAEIDYTLGLNEERRGPDASTLDTDLPLVHLTDEDCSILRALYAAHPKLLTQETIEGDGTEVSIRTIQSRLPSLIAKGLVLTPEGKRSGYGLSKLGLRTAGRLK